MKRKISDEILISFQALSWIMIVCVCGFFVVCVLASLYDTLAQWLQ